MNIWRGRIRARRRVEPCLVAGDEEIPLVAPRGSLGLLAAAWLVPALSVYPGARYRDACVSEIRNRPEERGSGG